MTTFVWAYEPLDELDGQTGFVSVDDDKLAAKLLKSGAVQDPMVGGYELKHIVPKPAKGGYKTREIKAETGRDTLSLPKDDKDPPKKDPPKDDEKKPGKGK